jgi:hypothetical protein
MGSHSMNWQAFWAMPPLREFELIAHSREHQFRLAHSDIPMLLQNPQRHMPGG